MRIRFIIRIVINQPFHKISKRDRNIVLSFKNQADFLLRVIFVVESEDAFLVLPELFIKRLGHRVFSARDEFV